MDLTTTWILTWVLSTVIDSVLIQSVAVLVNVLTKNRAAFKDILRKAHQIAPTMDGPVSKEETQLISRPEIMENTVTDESKSTDPVVFLLPMKHGI